MKKKYRNFYFLYISFSVIITLIVLYSLIWEKLFNTFNAMILIFFGAGLFALLIATLTKMGCIANPFSNGKVSEDEAIEKNFSFYDYLFMAVLCLLCGIIWYKSHGEFIAIFVFFIGLFIRASYYTYFKKIFKNK